MVWGSVWFHDVGTLIAVEGTTNAEKYTDIPEEYLGPVVTNRSKDTFMNANAPVHRAYTVRNCMKTNSINHTKRPAESSYLNPMQTDKRNRTS